MSSSQFHTPELLKCSKGLLFGKNTPQLPGPPLLAFDEIVAISPHGGKFGHGMAIARKELASLWPVFNSHFYGDPVLPGTLMVEGLLQLTGFFGAYLGWKGKGRAARVENVRFLAEVTPSDDEVLYRIDVKKSHEDSHIIIP